MVGAAGPPADLAVATAVAATVPGSSRLLFDESLPVSVNNDVEFWHPAARRRLPSGSLVADLAAASPAPAHAVVSADTAQGVAAVVRETWVAVVPARAVADGAVPPLAGLDRGTWLEPGSVLFGLRSPGTTDPGVRIGLAGSQPKAAGPQRSWGRHGAAAARGSGDVCPPRRRGRCAKAVPVSGARTPAARARRWLCCTVSRDPSVSGGRRSPPDPAFRHIAFSTSGPTAAAHACRGLPAGDHARCLGSGQAAGGR